MLPATGLTLALVFLHGACAACGPEAVADAGDAALHADRAAVDALAVDSGRDRDAGRDAGSDARATDAMPRDTSGARDAIGGDSVAGDRAATDTGSARDATGGADRPLTVDQILGLHDLSGNDPIHGAYTGQVEVRAGASAGSYDVIHLQDWTDASFENLDRKSVV